MSTSPHGTLTERLRSELIRVFDADVVIVTHTEGFITVAIDGDEVTYETMIALRLLTKCRDGEGSTESGAMAICRTLEAEGAVVSGSGLDVLRRREHGGHR